MTLANTATLHARSSTWPALNRPLRANIRVLPVNAAQCAALAERAALLHGHHAQQLGYAGPPSRVHHEEKVVNHGKPRGSRWVSRGYRGGGMSE